MRLPEPGLDTVANPLEYVGTLATDADIYFSPS